MENDFYTLDKSLDPYAWERTYVTGIEPLMGQAFQTDQHASANMLTKMVAEYFPLRIKAARRNHDRPIAARKAES
ncbi:MAG: hypothetical protein ACLU9S_02870 [Oscillospiraceae bacterium]